MSRKFLTNLNIVGAILAFREGETIRYCLNDLVKYCDHVVVVFDNQDSRTEAVVNEYKDKYGDLFTVKYSGIERLEKKYEEQSGRLKSRLKWKQDIIRESLLKEVLKTHKEKEIDILVWLDADECFTDNFPNLLKEFWGSDKQLLFMKYVTVFDSLNIIRGASAATHGKVYKYRSDMSAIPYRSRGFHHPFKREEVMVRKHSLVHLALLTERMRGFRKHYARRQVNSDEKLWELSKDVRKMLPREIVRAKEGISAFTVGDYLTKQGMKI